ncbi:hypothetical protein PT277_03655 [Acetobacteraceae bacterium ESL0709]|nr:hypothetical protein [Acetobacteraceae bacterium ESL0697]MDF7677796.1 hypothetical protein [Acetobacteraceae bacterium ESL0709]
MKRPRERLSFPIPVDPSLPVFLSCDRKKTRTRRPRESFYKVKNGKAVIGPFPLATPLTVTEAQDRSVFDIS